MLLKNARRRCSCLDGGQPRDFNAAMSKSDDKPKTLSPAAERALKEATQRRAEAERKAAERPKESPARALEPTRYGDWERKGLASDF
jgi:hypothetical protein